MRCTFPRIYSVFAAGNTKECYSMCKLINRKIFQCFKVVYSYYLITHNVYIGTYVLFAHFITTRLVIVSSHPQLQVATTFCHANFTVCTHSRNYRRQESNCLWNNNRIITHNNGSTRFSAIRNKMHNIENCNR